MSMSFINESTVTSSVTTAERTVYTIADLGIPTHSLTQQTIIGRTRSLSSLTKWEWTYLTVALLSLIIGTCLTIERLFSLRTDTSDFTFALLLFWTSCFCYIYVLQGILRERPFELGAFIATTIIVIVYVIFNYCTNDQNRNTIKIVRLSVTCSIGPFLMIGGVILCKQYYSSKKLIFRTVGANAEMQTLCERLFLASSLLKFDVQLGGSALILWLKKGFLNWTVTQGYVVGFGAGITAFWMALGFLAMRFESKTLIYIFISTSFFEPCIIIWNLIRYHNGDDEPLEYAVYIAGIIALTVRIATVIVVYIVMVNFGRGLKEKVYGNGTERYRESSPQTDDR